MSDKPTQELGPDDVNRMVAAADLPRIVRTLAPLDEKQRKKLSTRASELRRLINRAESAWDNNRALKIRKEIADQLWPFSPAAKLKDDGPQTVTRQLYRMPQTRKLLAAADLVCLGVCPISVTRAIDDVDTSEAGADSMTVQILDDRRPDWASEWLEARCEGDDWGRISWETARPLIEKGICERPTTEGYVQIFVDRIWWRWHHHVNPDEAGDRIDYLIANPDLLDHEVWRLFEVETGAFTWNSSETEGWPAILVELMQRGHLDRERLLDASLDGAASGLPDHVAGGIAKFHALLKPTPDEATARLDRYLDLLSNPSARLVGFAIDQLKALDKAKSLDDAQVLERLADVFTVTTKGPAKASLTLLKKIAKRQRKRLVDAARVAAAGLLHTHVDVQTAAVTLLEEWADAIDDDTREALATAVEDVSPALAPRVKALLGELGVETEGEHKAVDLAAEVDEFRKRSAALPDDIRATLHLTQAIDAATHGELPAPLAFTLADVPLLELAEPVTPIETIDELIDAVAHAVEVVDDPMEVERILDGMVRLLDQRPDDFAERVAPLRKRVEPTEDHFGRGIGGNEMTTLVAEPALHAWLGIVNPQHRDHGASRMVGAHPATQCLHRRCVEVGEWVVAGTARPLLSLPTHRGGWVDPGVLIERLTRLQEENLELPAADFKQALLRIPPGGHSHLLTKIESLTGTAQAVMRYALTGEAPATDELKAEDARFWLAAGRGRTPRATLDNLQSLADQLAGPDGIEPASYRWRASCQRTRDEWWFKHNGTVKYNVFNALHISVKPELVEHQGHPKVDLHPHPLKKSSWERQMSHARWAVRWIELIWPAQADPMLAHGAEGIVRRLDDKASIFDPNDAYLVSLLDSDRPWSEMSRLALWAGLTSFDAEVRGLVIDALIEAIADGRAHPEPLGETLAKLATGGWVKLSRLCANLGDVSRVSPLHAFVVARCLKSLLPALDPMPRDAYLALTLLLELHTQLGLGVDDELRPTLESFTGSGKAAKGAKALLKLKYVADHPERQEALRLAIEARLERAERWAAAGSG